MFRTSDDFSVYYEGESDFWSYCDPRCRGERPEPDSEYNLAAGAEHGKVWTSVLLDLRTYEPGYCHTYDPPAASQPGRENGLYFLLGKMDNLVNNSDGQYMMYSFNIFLHDKVSLTISNSNNTNIMSRISSGTSQVCRTSGSRTSSRSGPTLRWWVSSL